MKTDWTDDPLLSQLLAGKRELRDARRTMTLPEKVRQIVELQKIYVTTAKGRRQLGELETVWQIDDLR